jgi:serralysin
MTTPLYNIVDGTPGNDQLAATAQADLISAGLGIDTVSYPGNSTDYNLIPDVDKLLVRSLAHPDDSDVLAGVELLRFNGISVDLRTEATVEALYLAYFNRPADYYGMVNFSKYLHDSNAPLGIPELAGDYLHNAPLKVLVDSLGTSQESVTRYGDGGDSASLVRSIFQNLLGRDPAQPGLDFWRDALDAGHMTKPQAALTIMAAALQNGSPQGLQDAALIEKKICASLNFFHKTDTAVEVVAYAGGHASAIARAMLGEVGASTDMAAFDHRISETLEQMQLTHAVLQGAAPVVLVGVSGELPQPLA